MQELNAKHQQYAQAAAETLRNKNAELVSEEAEVNRLMSLNSQQLRQSKEERDRVVKESQKEIRDLKWELEKLQKTDIHQTTINDELVSQLKIKNGEIDKYVECSRAHAAVNATLTSQLDNTKR